MIKKLEYWSGGTNIGGVINWQHHPNLDDVIDKVNELIEKDLLTKAAKNAFKK